MRIISILLFSFLVFTCSEILASTYYVSTTGSDTTSGTFAAPYASIQHGSNQLLPGDSLLIRGGSYSEKIFLNNSGEGCYQDAVVIFGNVGDALFGGAWNASSSTIVKGNIGMNESCGFLVSASFLVVSCFVSMSVAMRHFRNQLTSYIM